MDRPLRPEVQRHGAVEHKSASIRTAASSSTAMFCHGGGCRNRDKGSQAYEGRCSRSSEARGCLFCQDRSRPDEFESLGKIAKPLSAPEKCIGNALFNEVAEVSKMHLQLVEMCMLSFAAGGLLPAGTASTTEPSFPYHPLSWSLGETKKTAKHSNVINHRMSVNQLACPSWRKVVQTKKAKSGV